MVLLKLAAFWNVFSPANVWVVVSTTPFALLFAEVRRPSGTVPNDNPDALRPVILVVNKTLASSRARGTVPVDSADAFNAETNAPLPENDVATTAPVNVLSPANVWVVVSTTPFALLFADVSRASGTVPTPKLVAFNVVNEIPFPEIATVLMTDDPIVSEIGVSVAEFVLFATENCVAVCDAFTVLFPTNSVVTFAITFAPA